MPELNYITRTETQGSVSIAEDVIAAIACEAVRGVDGVGALAGTRGGELADRLGKKASSRGVKVSCEENDVEVEVFFLVQYGAKITEVARAAQEAVVSNVEAITGLSVRQVNITVCGVIFGKTK